MSWTDGGGKHDHLAEGTILSGQLLVFGQKPKPSITGMLRSRKITGATRVLDALSRRNWSPFGGILNDDLLRKGIGRSYAHWMKLSMSLSSIREDPLELEGFIRLFH